jgi:hypothetical protein
MGRISARSSGVWHRTVTMGFAFFTASSDDVLLHGWKLKSMTVVAVLMNALRRRLIHPPTNSAPYTGASLMMVWPCAFGADEEYLGRHGG